MIPSWGLRIRLGLVLVVMLSSVGVAGAQVRGVDQVGGQAGEGVHVQIDAHSGPYGESPSGTVSWTSGGRGASVWEGRVTCLGVDDRTAVIGFSGTFWYPSLYGTRVEWPATGIVRVVDRGVSSDTLEYAYDSVAYDNLPPGAPPRTLIPAPTDCSSFPAGFPESPYGPIILRPGGLVVTDAPLLPPPPAPPELSVWRERDLRLALTSGIWLQLTCESPCRVRARLYIGAKQARKLKLTAGRNPVTVAKVDARLRDTSSQYVLLRFTKKARKRLKQARVVKLVLKATLSANNQSRTRSYKLRLAAVKH